MNNYKVLTFCLALAALQMSSFAQAPSGNADPEAKMEEFVEKEIEKWEVELKLEDWQVFYMDSTLKHDYSNMTVEMMALQKARVENPDLYYNVQDKWVEATQLSYRRFFSPEQWKLYLKRGGERIILERERRRAKVNGQKVKEISDIWK